LERGNFALGLLYFLNMRGVTNARNKYTCTRAIQIVCLRQFTCTFIANTGKKRAYHACLLAAERHPIYSAADCESGANGPQKRDTSKFELKLAACGARCANIEFFPPHLLAQSQGAAKLLSAPKIYRAEHITLPKKLFVHTDIYLFVLVPG